MKYCSSLLLICFISLNGFAQYDLNQFRKVDSSSDKINSLLSKIETIKALTVEESKAQIAWEKLDGHINTLKAELKQYGDADLKFPKHLFFERNEGKKLYIMLKHFQELAIDKQPDSIATKMKETLNLDAKGQNWAKLYFENVPVIAAVTMLGNIQNDMLTCIKLF